VRKSSAGLFWGGFLVVVGLLWLLDNTGAYGFDFGEMIQRGWPIIIIALGVWMLTGRSDDHKVRATVSVAGDASEKLSHGLGDVELTPEALDARGLQVRVGAGEVKLDLRPTRLTEAENTVYVKVGLGDVRIDIPRDLPVSVDARTGGGDLHFGHVPPVPQRLEDPVAETKSQDVLHRLLAQVVVDAVDLPLRK